MSPNPSPSQKQVLATLAHQMRRLERSASGTGVGNAAGHVSSGDVSSGDVSSGDVSSVRTTGIGALDELLVEGGVPPGCLMEWLEAGSGAGVETLALWAAARARRPNELLMVIDSRRDFYPPGGAPLGVDWHTTVVIRPRQPDEALWTLEQALRTPGVGVVVCPWQRLSPPTLRRLQLAAEQGGSLGVLLRPARDRGEPSFAEVRWWVQPLPSTVNGPRRWRVELLRARRQVAGGSLELELHDNDGRLHLVPAVVPAKRAAPAVGA